MALADLWGALGALAAVVLPMALAWWLLGRKPGRGGSATRSRVKMPGEEER